MPAVGGVTDPATSSPPFHPMLFPRTEKCLACGLSLESPQINTGGEQVFVNTVGHGPILCSAFKLICGTCSHEHYYSHHHGKVKGSPCFLSPGALDQPYLLLWGTSGGGKHHGFEVKLLDQFLDFQRLSNDVQR
jgi:hypothetical protein